MAIGGLPRTRKSQRLLWNSSLRGSRQREGRKERRGRLCSLDNGVKGQAGPAPFSVLQMKGGQHEPKRVMWPALQQSGLVQDTRVSCPLKDHWVEGESECRPT